MSLRTGGLLTAAMVAAAVVGAPTAHAAGTVGYSISSDAPLVWVKYVDGTNTGVTEDSDLGRSWTKTFDSQVDAQRSSVQAVTTGTTVSCRIIRNGQLAQSHTGTGPRAGVGCTL